MKYRNVRTGNLIDISSELHDKEWEPVEAPASEEKSEEKPVQKRTKKK